MYWQCSDLPETRGSAPAALRPLQPWPGIHPGTQPVQQAAHHHLPGSQTARTRLREAKTSEDNIPGQGSGKGLCSSRSSSGSQGSSSSGSSSSSTQSEEHLQSRSSWSEYWWWNNFICFQTSQSSGSRNWVKISAAPPSWLISRRQTCLSRETNLWPGASQSTPARAWPTTTTGPRWCGRLSPSLTPTGTWSGGAPWQTSPTNSNLLLTTEN